jgi:hypothetical protein
VNKPTLIAALALAAALASAASAQAVRLAGVPNLPPGWSHAEINVVIRRQPHTLIYDRGRVQSVTGSSLTLRERDGNAVTVAVGSSTKVVIAGRPATLAQIRPREVATTVSLDGGPAMSVFVRIPPAVAAALARQQARAGQQTTTTTTTTQ